MSDKTQLVNIQKYLCDQPIDIINYDDGEYYLSTESALELAQQIMAICQPQWIAVTDDRPDIQWCRVIIGEHEQEMFYRRESGVWLRQSDNGFWIASAFIPSYYFIMPPLPEDAA